MWSMQVISQILKVSHFLDLFLLELIISIWEVDVFIPSDIEEYKAKEIEQLCWPRSQMLILSGQNEKPKLS